MDKVYVFGHKNPDTDSICSAITYAHLKNTQTQGHLPVRLGDLNRETKFVLDSFDVPEPDFIQHVHTRVEDVMTTDVISAPATCTIHDIGQLMHEHTVRAIPIVDENQRVQGVVTEHTLARSYLKEMTTQGLRDTVTELGKIVETLNGRLLVGDPQTRLKGHLVIGAMSPESMVNYISPGDLVALGNRENGQEAALECNISCLIITGDFDPTQKIIDLARQRDAAIIVTPFDTFATARLINLSMSVQKMIEPDLLTTTPDSLIKEIAPELADSRMPIVIVNNSEGRLVGVLSETDIVTLYRRRVILVDHSERSQSADGVENAEILEILDHHRLGGLQTSEPIMAMIAPVGCTATLVLRRYKEMGVEPPPAMAGLMAAAILSDTMLTKSPTTTPEDVRAIEYLGQVMGEDALAFGRRMYDAKFNISAMSPTDIVTNDLKIFSFSSATAGIGQLEVADKSTVLERKAEILEAMAAYQADHNLDLMVLMVSDILLEGTELLAVGHTRPVEKGFGVSLQEQAVYLPGVLSRKKQVVPPISNAM